MNYKEQAVSGSQWQRCNRVTIDNPYQGTPQITLHEEVITLAGDAVFHTFAGAISMPFDPTGTVDLLDPESGAPLGASMTQAQIYVALWSLYISCALARDAAAPEPVEPEPVGPEP